MLIPELLQDLVGLTLQLANRIARYLLIRLHVITLNEFWQPRVHRALPVGQEAAFAALGCTVQARIETSKR